MNYFLMFQSRDISFCKKVLNLMQQHLNLGSINFALKDPEKSARAEKYYLKHKKDLTADIIC